MASTVMGRTCWISHFLTFTNWMRRSGAGKRLYNPRASFPQPLCIVCEKKMCRVNSDDSTLCRLNWIRSSRSSVIDRTIVCERKSWMVRMLGSTWCWRASASSET